MQLESRQDLAYLHSEIHAHLSTAHAAILASKLSSDATGGSASAGDGKKRGAVFVAPASTEEDLRTVCLLLSNRLVC